MQAAMASPAPERCSRGLWRAAGAVFIACAVVPLVGCSTLVGLEDHELFPSVQLVQQRAVSGMSASLDVTLDKPPTAGNALILAAAGSASVTSVKSGGVSW